MKAVKVMKNNFDKQLEKNGEYWKNRFEKLEENAVKKGADYYESLDKEYRKAQKAIDAKINVWYQRFANNNEISLAEARKLLNSDELEEFKWDVEDYIKYGKENAFTEEWMKELENASAKVHISRLESLKLQMQQEVEVLYGNQLDGIDKLARDIYTDGYYHTAFEIQKGFNVGWDFASIDSRRLEKVISKPWTADGKTFSDKLWTQKNDLISTLHTELTQGIMRGLAPDKAIKTISDKFKVAKSKAGRLVMTESAYFASASQKDCFNELDVEKFEIVATLDSHTSELCQSMDGVVQDMKDFQPGVTAPPFHPWCRSTTVPYFDDDFGERAARGADGKTYYVPSDMKYGEWKEKFVDGKSSFMSVEDSSRIDWLPRGENITVEQYKELRTYANEKGITLRGFKNSDVDIELAKEFIDDASSMIEKYPILKGTDKKPFTFELANGMSSADFAETPPGVTHIIKLNADAMRDKTKLMEEYSKLANDGWFVKGTDYHSIIYHEMGHIISDKYDIDSLEIAKSAFNSLGKNYNKGEILDYLEENLSQYSVAKKDGSEIISEVFSAYHQEINGDFVLTFMKMCDII
jgi:SPP1 gp7 family putative phage head morphogenesis protein